MTNEATVFDSCIYIVCFQERLLICCVASLCLFCFVEHLCWNSCHGCSSSTGWDQKKIQVHFDDSTGESWRTCSSSKGAEERHKQRGHCEFALCSRFLLALEIAAFVTRWAANCTSRSIFQSFCLPPKKIQWSLFAWRHVLVTPDFVSMSR